MKPFLRVIIIFIFATFICTVNAQERTISDVIDEVYSFLASDSVATKDFGNSSTYKTQMQVTRITRDTTTYFYAVNMPNGGWAIVSNEQRYNMIIGYSMDSHFDTNPDNQPDALKLLLEFHMDMIDSVRAHPKIHRDSIYSEFTSSRINMRSRETSYLLKRDGMENLWRQDFNYDYPDYHCDRVYNKFCPTSSSGSCGRTIVGCVAVALAQVLWYWHWPDYANINDTIHAGIPSGPERAHYYDWDNMPPYIENITPIYQADMVAGLLMDCGYAAHMLYGASSSESGPIRLENALRNTFHFHVDRYLEVDLISDSYAPVLQYEIQQQRPIICTAGTADLEGHTFVIDGYDSLNDTYHINWGWGLGYNCWCDIDFNGYTIIRTFFTELYPNCNAREASVTDINIDTIYSDKDVTLYSANNVSMNNIVVLNGGHLNVSVGGSINLGSGFIAQLGSSVKLAPNYNCTFGTTPAPVSVPKQRGKSTNDAVEMIEISITPNPAYDEIDIQCEIPMKNVCLFDINGKLLIQTSKAQINISSLPQGLYIVRAITENGHILQAKVIHL